ERRNRFGARAAALASARASRKDRDRPPRRCRSYFRAPQRAGGLPVVWTLLAIARRPLSAELSLPAGKTAAAERARARRRSHRDEPGSSGLARSDRRGIAGRERLAGFYRAAHSRSRRWGPSPAGGPPVPS